MLSKNNAPHLSEPVFPAAGSAGFANAEFPDIDALLTDTDTSKATKDKFAPAEIKGRLPTAFVREVESMLESTYMPFYFHDLRTNEIISFHAFVENISDSFSPQWNEVGGFGRMDSVQIYNSTQRSISLDFWIAAMDRSDFDEVWFAINRLVMLVYPQWSRGDQKATGDLSTVSGGDFFIQPFSQIPTASPLIRMRLGELFKSNYSVHNLKRLFGLMTDSFKLKAGADFDERMDKVVVLQAELAKRMATKTESNYPDADKAVAAMAGGGALKSVVVTGGGFKYEDHVTLKRGTYVCAQGDKTGFRPKHLKTTVTVESSCPAMVVGFIVTPLMPTFMKDKKLTASKRGRIPRVVKYVVGWPADTSGTALKSLVEDTTDDDDVKGVIVDRSDLDFDMKWETKEAMQAVFGKKATGLEAALGILPEEIDFDDITGASVKDFFAGNPIIRSFEESGGSGLAGVITSMNFDWNTAPWELDEDSRAPTAVKVSLGFTPIHDIPLGLDHDGVMRAAAYPVGQVMASIMGSPTSEYGDLAAALKQKIKNQKFKPASPAATKVKPPATKPGETP